MRLTTPKMAAIGAGALIVTTGGLMAAGVFRGPAKAPTQIKANGTIEADEVEVGAQRPAKLAEYKVAEGAAVRKGDIIAVLETGELKAQVASAEGGVLSSEARLQELLKGSREEEKRIASAQLLQAQATLTGAGRSLDNARTAFGRRTNLRQALDAAEAGEKVAREAVAQAEAAVAGAEDALKTAQQEYETSVQLKTSRDGARQGVDTGEAALRIARANLLQLQNGTRPEVLRAGEAAVSQAESAVKTAQEELDNAASDLKRTRELHAGRAASDQQLDAAETRAKTSRSRMTQGEQALRQAVARLAEMRAGPRAEEIDAARAAVQQAQAALEGNRRTLENAQQAYDLRLGAKGSVDLSRTQVRVAKAQTAGARAQLAGAQLTVRNARTAYEDALGEKQGVDTARQMYDGSVAQLKSAKAQLDLRNNGATPEQIAQARAQLLQARAGLSLARVQYEQSVIRAPVDGVVTDHVALVGEVVNPGATVARLVALDRAYLTLYIPLTELGKVQREQPVRVTADTYPGKEYRGMVTEISDTPEFTPRNVQTKDERVKLVFRLKVQVENPNRELKPGMPADATIDLSGGRAGTPK
jgi:HlyD family secretion protein